MLHMDIWTCCIDDEEDIATSQKPLAIALSLTLHNPRVSQVDRNAIPSGASEVHSTAISLAPSQLEDFLVEEFQLACNCPKSMKLGALGFSFSNCVV